MENKMHEVAKLLGLELGEEFSIGDTDKYVLLDDGLFKTIGELTYWQVGIENLLTGEWDVVKLPKPILNEKEKEYLSAVIKPFRNKIDWVRKFTNPTENLEYIKISYRDNDHNNVLNFPDFKRGTMYRGMKIGKSYTLKELGL